MDRFSEDEAARLERFKRWAADQEPLAQQRGQAEQRRLASRLARASRRTMRALTRTARQLSRSLDRVGDTGPYTASEPEHAHPNRVGYEASAWHVLPRALRYTGVSDRDTFVDFGCGKGTVVQQAARRPFGRVIGVEISPILAEIARTGLAVRKHQHRCGMAEIVVSDATQFPVPDDLTIGYFFHPFTGETFDAVLRNIVASIDSHPRRVRLIYVYPAQGATVLATGRFRLLKEQRGGLRDSRLFRAAIFESC